MNCRRKPSLSSHGDQSVSGFWVSPFNSLSQAVNKTRREYAFWIGLSMEQTQEKQVTWSDWPMYVLPSIHHHRLIHHFHCLLTFCNAGIYKPAEQWQLEDRMPPTKKRHGSMVFTLKEMEEATCSFSDENLVGKGGFGRVYKGTLRSGEVH